jgi:hypothetical protein
MESPSEKLAQNIVERLTQEKLLSPERGKRLLSGLAEGSLTAEDWQLEIELSQQTEEQGQDHDEQIS